MSDFNIQLDDKAVDELKEAVGGGQGGGDSTFVVTVTQGVEESDPAWINDKTPEEIYNACVSGKLVYAYHFSGTSVIGGLILAAMRNELADTYEFEASRNYDMAGYIEWDNKNQVFIIHHGEE